MAWTNPPITQEMADDCVHWTDILLARYHPIRRLFACPFCDCLGPDEPAGGCDCECHDEDE